VAAIARGDHVTVPGWCWMTVQPGICLVWWSWRQGGCASMLSGILGPELDGGEYGVEWLQPVVITCRREFGATRSLPGQLRNITKNTPAWLRKSGSSHLWADGFPDDAA
jgi:hypothetical protein